MENDLFAKTQIKKINILWIALVAEFIIGFLISYFLLVSENPVYSNNISHQYLLYFSYLSVIVSIPVAYYIFDRRIKLTKSVKSLSKKADLYFIASVIKYVLFEFGGVFSLIAYVITERNEPLYMFAIVSIALLINKPSVFRFKKDILNEEINNAEKPDTDKEDSDNKPDISVKRDDFKINLN